MDRPRRMLENSSAISNVNYGGPPVQEDSGGYNISYWARYNACDNLVKNGAAFWPHFKILSEVKLKNIGLINFLGRDLGRA